MSLLYHILSIFPNFLIFHCSVSVSCGILFIYEKIISKNELNNHIFLYDNKISKTILFSLSNNKQYRKIIENCLGKHFEFIIVRAEDEILILINITIPAKITNFYI